MPFRISNKDFLQKLLEQFYPPDAISRITRTPINYTNLPSPYAGIYNPMLNRMFVNSLDPKDRESAGETVTHESAHALVGSDLIVDTLKRLMSAPNPEEREKIKHEFMPKSSTYPFPSLQAGAEAPAFATEWVHMGPKRLELLRNMISNMPLEKRETYKRLLSPSVQNQLREGW